MSRNARVAVTLMILCLALPLGAAARQILVAQDGSGGFRTIRGAIDSARYGDEIYVSPGLYEEHVRLKDGITLIGAGAATTRIKYGYGFEEVLTAENVSTGRVEGFTIEREASILPGPAVVLDSASVTIVDCAVIGGDIGIEIEDETSRPTIARVKITGNGSEGIRAGAGARPRIVDCEISGNGGSGILLTAGASSQVGGGSITANAGSAIALSDDATVTIEGARLRENGGWGIDLNDRSSASVSGAAIEGNREGGVRLRDQADLAMSGTRIAGGGRGIGGYGSSALSIADSVIVRTEGAGISLEGGATGEITGSEIVGCGSDGVIVGTSGTCTIDRTTIVENGEDGLRIERGSVSVSNTIIAYNASAGIRYAPAGGGIAKVVTSHNDVVGNGTADYAGISRRPSDISAPPGFVDLAGGDLSLRPGSPCIGAGEWGGTIGAHPDPDREPGTIVELTAAYPALLGIDWSVHLRLSPSPFSLETLQVEAAYAASRTSFSLTGSLLGAWGTRVEGEGSLSLSERPLPVGGAEVTASCGFAGALAGAESWGLIWGEGDLTGDGYGIAASFSFGLPSGSSARVEIGLGRRTRLVGSAHLTDLAADSLAVGVEGGAPLGRGTITFRGEASLIPDRSLEVSLSQQEAGWETSLEILAYLDRSRNWRGRLAFHLPREGATARIEASLHGAKLTSGSLSVGVGSDPLRGEAELGITEGGRIRFSIGFEADLELLLSPPPDLPPVPSFSVYPAEPEVGETVRFDGSGSADPDGRIVEHFWDFGDGGLGMGKTVEHTYAAPGEYDVSLAVTDDDGVPASIVQRLTVYPADTAPVASFVWGAVSAGGTPLDRPVRTTDRIRLDASGSYDPDGEIVEYDWDLDSDGEFEILTADPILILPPFGEGTHPVTLRVIDGDDRSTALMHAIVVEAPTPPKAEFALTPSSPSVLDPIRFTDRSTDADGAIVAWEWDFGDGRTAREKDPVHRYPEAGEYRVVLTVIDDDGQRATVDKPLRVSRIPEVVPVAGVWALIIGISDYAEVKDLAFGRADAEGVCRWALDAGIPPDHIRLLTDRTAPLPGREAVTSAPASLVNVREGLGWLRRMAREDDLVMIYFSGHGYQGLDDGTDEADGLDEFFVLQDTRAGAIDDTALRDDEFGRFLDRLESEHVLVLFDGCYSGGLARSLAGGYRPAGSSPDIFSDLALEGRLILSASAEGEEAFESVALGHGVFTYFALEGLKGKADLNGDSRITAWELYEYVSANVPGYVREELGEKQIPAIVGEGDVRVVVAGLPRPPQAGISFSPTIPFAFGPISFTDETVSDLVLLSHTWDFGDGDAATTPTAVHTYAEPGVYTVLLTVTDPAGRVATASMEIAVGPPGRVVSVDEANLRGIVSLGGENGIRVGDLLSVIPQDGEEMNGRIEIIELVGGEEAVFRPIDDGGLPEVGSLVRPAD